jgi:hypothetical protein
VDFWTLRQIGAELGISSTTVSEQAARRAAHSLAALGCARVFHLPGADDDDTAGDRNYLVLTKPTMDALRSWIMNAELAPRAVVDRAPAGGTHSRRQAADRA